MDISGLAADTLRFLHNNIHAGGGSESVGVFMGSTLMGTGANEVGVFVGNIVDKGTGTQSFGFFESCSNTARARPDRAVNSNFFPVGDGTVLASHVSDSGCMRSNITTLDTLHQTAPYDRSIVFSGTSYTANPAFLMDGFHVPNTSPVRNRADETYGYWNAISRGQLEDIDGQSRPIFTPDIGVDEAE